MAVALVAVVGGSVAVPILAVAGPDLGGAGVALVVALFGIFLWRLAERPIVAADRSGIRLRKPYGPIVEIRWEGIEISVHRGSWVPSDPPLIEVARDGVVVADARGFRADDLEHIERRVLDFAATIGVEIDN